MPKGSLLGCKTWLVLATGGHGLQSSEMVCDLLQQLLSQVWLMWSVV